MTRSVGLARLLAVGSLVAACSDKKPPPGPAIVLPPMQEILDHGTGCDPDWIPAQHCWVFPVSDLHAVLGRGAGTWAALRDKLAAEKIRMIEVSRNGISFGQVDLDDHGRIVRQQAVGTPNVDWQINYAADGSVLDFDEANGSQPGAFVRREGKTCVAINRNDASWRACQLDGEMLVREVLAATGPAVVKGSVRGNRLETETGDSEVRDAQGRVVERTEGGIARRIEYTAGAVKTFKLGGPQPVLEETLELGPNGLVVRRTLHTINPPTEMTFSYSTAPAATEAATPPAPGSAAPAPPAK